MYSVSNAYKTAARATTRDDKLTGTITFSDGETVNLTDSNFGSGSVSITRQCVSGQELEFGAAILAELDLSLRTSRSRYSFYDAVITLYYSIKTASTPSVVWESVPLGVFTVEEAERTGTLVKLVAYDNLQKLDVNYGDTAIVGTPYDVLAEICDTLDLTFGITESEMEDWPNADQIIQIDSTNGCKSFREAVKIVCQMIGAFAEADRAGNIVVRQFHQTSDVTLTEHHRYKLTLADYTCSYDYLEVTGLAGTFTSEVEEPAGNLTMYMTDAAAWDYGLDATLQARADTLLEYLADITYTPCDLNMPGDPAFDVGDRVSLSIGATETIDTLITSMTWKYRASMDIESVGQNPYFLANGTSQSGESRIIRQETEANKIVQYNFTNAETITIDDGETATLYLLEFATVQTASVLFHASIILNVDNTTGTSVAFNTNASFYDDSNTLIPITGSVSLPGYADLTVKYTIDSIVQDFQPLERYSEGDHTLVLFLPIAEVSSRTLHSLKIELTADGGDVTIDAHNIKGTLFGQNLSSGAGEWDGTLAIDEYITTFEITPATIYTLTDSTSAQLYTPTLVSPSDSIEVIAIPAISLYSLSSSVHFNYGDEIDINKASTLTFNSFYVKTSNNKFELQTTYNFTGVEQIIDSGRLFSISVNLQQFARTDNMEVIVV